MHPVITAILRNPQQRAIIERALAARGNRGDTMLAHIDPREAGLLRSMGGVGTRNPKTGLLQFYPGAGGAGGMGLGGSGGEAGSDPSGRGNAGSGNQGGNQGSGGYTGTHASGPGFGSGPTNSPSGGYGQYGSNGGYNGGITINSGKMALKGVGALLGPIGMAVAGGYGLLGPDFGPSLNIGGTTNGYQISGDKTGVYSLGGGWGGGPNNVGGNVGATGGGLHDGGLLGSAGFPGQPGGGPGTGPAPAATPAGLPPAINPALASLFYGGQQGDPFGGRFGPNAGLLRYLIAQGQPAGSQLLG